MAACKAMADASHGIPCSSMVTCMARNGTDFGIKVSGLGDTWFTAQAQAVRGSIFGHGPEEANPTWEIARLPNGCLGGFALVSAPATMQIVEGSWRKRSTRPRDEGDHNRRE